MVSWIFWALAGSGLALAAPTGLVEHADGTAHSHIPHWPGDELVSRSASVISFEFTEIGVLTIVVDYTAWQSCALGP